MQQSKTPAGVSYRATAPKKKDGIRGTTGGKRPSPLIVSAAPENQEGGYRRKNEDRGNSLLGRSL